MGQIQYWWGRMVAVFSGEGGASSRVARGSLVLFLGRFLLKGVYFVRTIVLAHLLFPSDFGLFGLASLSLGFTTAFFVSGLNASIVHAKEEPIQYLNGVWTVNIIRNTLLALLVFATAPLAAQFFNNAVIIPMIGVLALTIFIDGFANVGIVLLEKELQFNRKFLFDVSIVILEVFSVILAALLLHSAWALVVGALANRIIGVVLSYVFHPYRPHFTRDLSGVWRLFHYGKWVSFTAILGFLISQGDNAVVGRMLSVEELGYYQLAFTLAFIPALEFSRVLGNVLFPMFAKLEQLHQSLERSFIEASRMIFAVVTPMSFGLLLVVPEFVHVFYGPQWSAMVPIVNVLLIYGFLRSFEFIAKPLFMGIGKPKITFFTQVAQFVGMFLFIVPLTNNLGAVGTAWAVVIGGCASVLVLFIAIQREFHFSLHVYKDMFLLSTVAAFAMYGILFGFRLFVPIAGGYLLLFDIVFGALLYIVFLFSLDLLYGKKIINSLLWLKRKL